MKKIYLFILSAVLLAVPALAAEPELMRDLGVWQVYRTSEGSNALCYMLAEPQLSEGAYKKRDAVYAMLAYRPAEKGETFSFIAGYNFKDWSKIDLIIDSQEFKLIAKGDTGWAANKTDDQSIAKAMAQGSKMTIRGVSARGTATTDVFSLKNTGNAQGLMRKNCDNS